MQKIKNDISLVMIAKNEEQGLAKAISSCRDFADEVIVSVDTASADKTLEVAKQYADKVVQHKWEGSFAKARNSAQKHAKTKWALHLDGHEYVQSWDNLAEMLKKDVDAIFVKIIMESGMTFYYPRIVKQKIQWQHNVHNTPKSKRNTKYDEFVIIHDRVHGQDKKAQEIREKQRTQMVETELTEPARKNKKNVRAHFYLGNLYLDKKQFKKAIPHYLKVAKHSEKPNQRWLARFHLGICYNELKKPFRALRHFWKAEKEQPNRWETAKMLGTTYAFLGWHKKALEHWVDSFKINTGKFMFCPILRNDAQTWDFISLTFAQMDKLQNARVAAQQALREEREKGPGLIPPEKIQILEAFLGQQPAPTQTKDIIEVCFLVYQRPQRVPEILNQLKNQTIQNFKVNIWNNSEHSLDTSNFPKERLLVINSKENVGSQARFKLAAKTTSNPIIFFDDDQDLHPNFINYNYQQYLKYGPKTILGWFTRTFDKEDYWNSKGAQTGSEVDYIATKAMTLDREIIDNEPLLQNIPKDFAKVEDLYLCYLARMKHQIKMIKIDRYTSEKPDGKDQYPNINKQKAFELLRKNGWWLLKDGIKNFAGFNFKIRQGVWDEQILNGETKPEYYQIPASPKVVVDIGAHIGGTSILCASMGAEVYAYEPEAENFKLLAENTKLNGLRDKVKCFELAVGRPGTRKLYLTPKNSGMTTLLPEGTPGKEAKVITIAEVFENIEHCDLLKIDCEGAEYEFIKDAPFEKIKQISMELHKGNQESILKRLRQFYQVHTKPAADGTSLMVFCFKKPPENPALDNLLTFQEVCNTLKIPFALAHGTLLGAYRNKDFIKGDERDVDITIDEKFAHLIPALFAELEMQGFKTIRHFIYQQRFRTGALARNNSHIDVLIIHKKGDDAYIIGPPRAISKKPYTAFVYPWHCFERYDTIIFKGHKFNIPHKAEDFFVARYGKNWRTPQDPRKWSHLNPQTSPSLRPNYDI